MTDINISSGEPNLRASDTEREAIAARLRAHHTDGRLDTGELQERIDRCYQAKTRGELRDLLADLPGEEPEPKPERSPRIRAPLPLLALVTGVLVLAATGAAVHHHAPWLVLPVLFIAARVMLFRRWRWGARRGRYLA
jgi:Flp pilus assembly protein TadB